MGMGGGAASSGPTVHNIRVTDSQYGVVLPIVYGRARQPGHLLWLGDKVATLQKGPGKGLSGSSGGSFYTYTAAVVIGLTVGPITTVGRRFTNNTGGLGRKSAAQNAKDGWSIFTGALGQAPWSHLTSKHPGQDLGYSEVSYMAQALLQLGTNPSLPQDTWEVFGLLPFSTNIKDSNPRDLIVDAVGNPYYGMAPAANWLDIGAPSATSPSIRASTVSATTTINVPTHTDGDSLYWIVTGFDQPDPPIGWEVIGSTGLNPNITIYGRIASTEPTSYTITGAFNAGMVMISVQHTNGELDPDLILFSSGVGTSMPTPSLSGLSSSSDLLIGAYCYGWNAATCTITETGSLTVAQNQTYTNNGPTGTWVGSLGLSSTNVAPAQGATASASCSWISVAFALAPASPGGTLSVGGSFSNYCVANNFFHSAVFDQQRAGRDWLRVILDSCHADGVWSEGTFRVVPYSVSTATGNGVTFSPNVTPLTVFTDDDYKPSKRGEAPVEVKSTDPVERNNIQTVEYVNVLNDYNIETVQWMDESDMSTLGSRRAMVKQYHPIPNAGMAQAIAELKGQWELYVNRVYTFTVSEARAALWDPMDVVGLNEIWLGLSNYPVRITEMEETGPTGANGLQTKITAEDIGPNQTPGFLQMTQPTGGSTPFSDATPPPDAVPVIFEPNFLFTDQYEIWMGVCSGGQDDWGGCQISMQAGSGSFEQVAIATNQAIMGTLLTLLPATPDPDITDTLAVDFTNCLGGSNNGVTMFSTIANADADAGYNLAYVDGEMICFAGVANPSGNEFDLTYLRRGVYGTPITSHAIGSNFVFLGSVRYPHQGVTQVPYPPNLVGQTVTFDFASFNLIQGMETDTSNDFAYTILGPNTFYVPTSAQPWGAGIAYATGSYVTFNKQTFFAVIGGTSGPSAPAFPNQFAAIVGDGTVTWQNVGPQLNITKGSVVGYAINSAAAAITFGSAPDYLAGTDYPEGTIVTDSNGNGEQVLAGLETVSQGNKSPGTWAGLFYFLPSSTATGAVQVALGSAQTYAAHTIAIAPLVGGTYASVVGFRNVNPASGTSINLKAPTSIVVGDVMIAQIGTAVAKTITAPSGWSLLVSSSPGTVQQAIYYKTATSGDIGATYNFSWSGSTAISGTIVQVTGQAASPFNTYAASTASGSVNNPSFPSVTPSVGVCLMVCLMTFGGTTSLTPANNAVSAPAWSGTDGAILQDGVIQWENIGPFSNYAAWTTIAEVTIAIDSTHDAVRMTLTGQTSTSNMQLNDKAQVRFLNVTSGAQIASGRMAVSAGTSTQVSGESAPVILRKTATGLSGTVQIAAQVRAVNGSGSGQFAFAVDSCDLAVEDQIK